MGVVTSTFRVVYQSGHVSKLGGSSLNWRSPHNFISFWYLLGQWFFNLGLQRKWDVHVSIQKVTKKVSEVSECPQFFPSSRSHKNTIISFNNRGEWASYRDKCHGRGGSRRVGGMWDGGIGRTWGELSGSLQSIHRGENWRFSFFAVFFARRETNQLYKNKKNHWVVLLVEFVCVCVFWPESIF